MLSAVQIYIKKIQNNSGSTLKYHIDSNWLEIHWLEFTNKTLFSFPVLRDVIRAEHRDAQTGEYLNVFHIFQLIDCTCTVHQEM